jgi:site-specific recombinase XerD
MTEESRKMFEKVRAFLTVYMPKQRGLSNNTVQSYKQAINQFLDFVSNTRKVSYEDVSFQNWDALTVNEFLTYLEDERSVSASTRNQRLFAIRAFLKFARISTPELMALSMDVSGILTDKEPK